MIKSMSKLWSINSYSIGKDLEAFSILENGATVARGLYKEDAFRIVHCVNSHDRLVEAARMLREAVRVADEAAQEWDKAPLEMRGCKILLALAGLRRGYRPDIDAIHAALEATKDLI